MSFIVDMGDECRRRCLRYIYITYLYALYTLHVFCKMYMYTYVICLVYICVYIYNLRVATKRLEIECINFK